MFFTFSWLRKDWKDVTIGREQWGQSVGVPQWTGTTSESGEQWDCFSLKQGDSPWG